MTRARLQLGPAADDGHYRAEMLARSLLAFGGLGPAEIEVFCAPDEAEAAHAAFGPLGITVTANPGRADEHDGGTPVFHPGMLAGARLPAAPLEVRFDAFGLVAASADADKKPTIDALNALIAEPSNAPAFGRYKRALARAQAVPDLPAGHPLMAATEAWTRAFPERIKLVLHAGTPKTGTKALQHALYRDATANAERGVWYPPALVDPVHKKHQLLVGPLIAGDGAALVAALDEAVRSAPPRTRTIVLSTEGLFQHWWDFAAESKAMLRQLAAAFDLEVWVCFREPIEFALTQYAQLVRNPRVFAPAYGLDADLETMLDNEWFARRLDYLGFIYDLEELIGASGVRRFRYEPDVVARIISALALPVPPAAAELVNPSLRKPGVDLMRIVNRYELPPERQDSAAALVLRLDQLLGDAAAPLRAGPEATRRIRQLTDRAWLLLG